MSLRLYRGVHVRAEVTHGLRSRGVDVLTAQEDGAARLSDPELLDRAGELGRLLFTQDEDFLAEAALRQQMAIPFSGVVFARQLTVSVGQCVEDLELIAKASEPDEYLNQLQYLPLR